MEGTFLAAAETVQEAWISWVFTDQKSLYWPWNLTGQMLCLLCCYRVLFQSYLMQPTSSFIPSEVFSPCSTMNTVLTSMNDTVRPLVLSTRITSHIPVPSAVSGKQEGLGRC